MSGSWVSREGGNIVNLVILSPFHNLCHFCLLFGKQCSAVTICVNDEQLSEAVSHGGGWEDGQEFTTWLVLVEHHT